VSGLGVIGNVSLDTTRYPDGRCHEQLGGAALYVALAAARAGLAAAPISVVGDDLAHLHADPRLAVLDLTRVLVVRGPSCRFELSYDSSTRLTGLTCSYGVADSLTGHATEVLVAGGEFDRWHVCCRRPLDTVRVLTRLIATDQEFSLDFHIGSAREQMIAAASALPRATTVFVNADEYELLADLIGAKTLPAVVITDGPRKVTLLRHGQITASAIPEATATVEVTGAGDTLTGAFLAEISRTANDHLALQWAVTAASQRIRSFGLRHPARQGGSEPRNKGEACRDTT
jgi:sugar/nucleoside kinase (ribokinase family)